MTVVDASGWVEYFTKGSNAKFLIRPVQAVAIMSHGRIVELDSKIAIDAAQLSLDLKLAMADSLILATAPEYDAMLWTRDAHFKDVHGVKYIEKKS